MKEIIAKKLRHRGDKQTARDLFDFALVAEKEPNELAAAARFVVRHIDTIFEQLALHANRLKLRFEAIDALHYGPSYRHAVEMLKARLAPPCRALINRGAGRADVRGKASTQQLPRT
jgi:hypothetical protein